MIDVRIEFLFIETMFINAVQRYFLLAKYKRLNFFLFQETSLPIHRLLNSLSIQERIVFQ